MRFAGNVIWFVSGGFVIAPIWLIGAATFAISIVGLPMARAAFEMAKMSAWPFGKDVVHIRELDNRGLTVRTAATGTIGFIVNIVWAMTYGWVLFLAYLIAGVINCATLIGIPLGLQSFKLAGISLWPVGRRVVTKELAQVARYANAEHKLATFRTYQALPQPMGHPHGQGRPVFDTPPMPPRPTMLPNRQMVQRQMSLPPMPYGPMDAHVVQPPIPLQSRPQNTPPPLPSRRRSH